MFLRGILLGLLTVKRFKKVFLTDLHFLLYIVSE